MTTPPQSPKRPRRPSPPPSGSRLREPVSPVLLAQSLPSTATLNELSALETVVSHRRGGSARLSSSLQGLRIAEGEEKEKKKKEHGEELTKITVRALELIDEDSSKDCGRPKLRLAWLVDVDLITFEVSTCENIVEDDEDLASNIVPRVDATQTNYGHGTSLQPARQHSVGKVPSQSLQSTKIPNGENTQWIFISSSAVPKSHQVQSWFGFQTEPLVRSARLSLHEGILATSIEKGFVFGVRRGEETLVVQWWEERFSGYGFALWPKDEDVEIEVGGRIKGFCTERFCVSRDERLHV